ncbi:MAG: response regulator transcription factor, partial [Microvirga sp.]
MDARIDIPDHAPHVLVVDDDRRLRDLLARFLTENGYRVTAAASAAEARAKAGNFVFDALVLDVMMPGETGFEYARSLREHSQVPILMLTARADASDRVTGLEIGADDYLPKPFEPRELVARLQTVLRRRGPRASDGRLRFEGLVVDPVTRTVQRQGEGVELTSTEFELLLLLARQPGRVFGRDEILNLLRGHEADLYTRAVDILVSRLRRKL